MPATADMSGLDVTADGIAVYPEQDPYAYPDQDPYFYVDGYDQAGYQGADERFFTASDEELEQWSRAWRSRSASARTSASRCGRVVLLILLAFGAAVFAYTQGYGYPSQETVVKQLFADPSAAMENVIAKDVGDDKAAAMLESGCPGQRRDHRRHGQVHERLDRLRDGRPARRGPDEVQGVARARHDRVESANVDYYASSQY